VNAVRRIGRDVLRRRHLDAYVVAAVALALALLTLLGGGNDDVRWSVALAALGILVYRVTLPEPVGDADAILRSRAAFADTTLSSRFRQARTLWVFGPSAVHLLSGSTGTDLRQTILAQPDGSVKVAVLDPAAPAVVALAARHLDDGLDFGMKALPEALAETVALLERIAGWDTAGAFEYRYAPVNPGFSLVAIDPEERHGVLIVEFHGFHNESTESRMHVELTRPTIELWYAYWLDQFTSLWQASRPPA
jgi:hypothetical protein